MTGFTLYETFRFVIPGAIAAALVSLTLRLATGFGPLYSGGPAESLITELGTARTFLFVALTLGFILYAMDLPVRARIYEEGDPAHGIMVPSRTLAKMLEACQPQLWISGKSLSVYFLLMDAHFPTELHKKVYFFGGLYRIYFDARILTTTALTVGPIIGLVVVRDSGFRDDAFHGAFALAAALSIILSISAGVVASVLHRNASKASRVRNGLPEQQKYRQRVREALRGVSGVATFIASAQVVAILLAMQEEVGVRLIGLVLATTALVCWGLFELGPTPVRIANQTGELPPRSIRASILNSLGCRDTEETRFIPPQRALVDAALMAPAMVAAANLTIEQGRSAAAVLWWAALLGIATFIVVSRKHEIRLLNSFRDQSTWLTWNKNKIEKRAQELAPDDSWA